jgi:hypothetical protein
MVSSCIFLIPRLDNIWIGMEPKLYLVLVIFVSLTNHIVVITYDDKTPKVYQMYVFAPFLRYLMMFLCRLL